MDQESYNICIREIFSILTQGVDLVMYETNPITLKSNVKKQVIWMDADIYRICFASTRSTVKNRARGKIPNGIFLRDISEVRDGAFSFDFTANQNPPEHPYTCLSIIGSEMTMSLQFPTKTTKDWFLKRFRLLMEDILVDEERSIRIYKIWESEKQLKQFIEPTSVDVSKLENLLQQRGIEVIHHQQTGMMCKAILGYNATINSLELRTKQTTGFFGAETETIKLIDISDISEIRPGCHSLSFIRTKSSSLDNETMSIVSSQNSFDLQFVNKSARDVFASRLYNLVLIHLVKRTNSDDEHDDHEANLLINNVIDEDVEETVVNTIPNQEIQVESTENLSFMFELKSKLATATQKKQTSFALNSDNITSGDIEEKKGNNEEIIDIIL